MESQRLIKILIHPFFIGLLISAIITIALNPDIPKYKVEVIERNNKQELRSFFFSDLDNDLTSEEIMLHNNPLRLNIVVFKGKRVIEQYNLLSLIHISEPTRPY